MSMWKPVLSSLHLSSLEWVNDTVQGLRLWTEHFKPCMNKNSYVKSDPFLCHGKVVDRYWTRWGENNWKLMQKTNDFQAKPVCFLFWVAVKEPVCPGIANTDDFLRAQCKADLKNKQTKPPELTNQPNPTCWNKREETCFVWQLLHRPKVEAALRAS